MSLLWVLLGCALALAICWVRVQSRREGVLLATRTLWLWEGRSDSDYVGSTIL